jgi:hypothetical protein
LIRKNVAYYMFGYFALQCWRSNNFWHGINKDAYYWSFFIRFAGQMQRIETARHDQSKTKKILDWTLRRNSFRY